MDEHLLKRNTDCVYFLASPLTCKKGVDCEYRHNEMARLNPRDCWYWFSGNCLNPTCGFRHPPLEGHTGSSELPGKKTPAPCYFFFNGFCNKGDSCSFLHGPNDSIPSVKSVKNSPGSTVALMLEDKTSSGNKTDAGSTPTKKNPSPSETSPKAPLDFKFQRMEDLQQPVPENVKPQSASQQISIYEYREPNVNRSDSIIPVDISVHGVSHLCIEQSLEEQVKTEHIKPEERWESSPGFDVLVDDESENGGYEDNSEYLPVFDREQREVAGQYLGPEADILYEEEIYDGYRYLDNEQNIAIDRRVPSYYSREIVVDSILSRKRIYMPDEMAACDRNLDLRDHLRRRREFSGLPVKGFLSSHESSRLMVQSEERHLRRGIDRRISRRLTSEVGLNTLGSLGEGETLSIANKHGLFRHSQQRRSRKQYREKPAKRKFLSSNTSRKPVSKERRSIQESTTFTGPKTLAQIKEDKKAEENGHFKSTSSDFQDPKPLSEILKEKRSLGCVRMEIPATTE
ncbi:hypothetical protein L6164_011373 [Bauhinia variegata]|uniref:Uncharacterized protein n=1 Tax=Bauhinia variegata TaxID=167791 RepID=A0ACB9P808_BAUVA|nr:hypothetical protein L6164_011373 [Bauhinia variegata]